MAVIDGSILEGVSAATLWTMFSAAAGPDCPARRWPAQHHPAGVRVMTGFVAFLRGVNVGGVNRNLPTVEEVLRWVDSAR